MKNIDKKIENAVSNIIGTMLLLGITISFFTVVCYIVLSYPSNTPTPSADLVGMIDKDKDDNKCLFIENRGGESLSSNIKVLLSDEEGNSKYVILQDCLNDDIKDGWSIGEWFVYPLPDELCGNELRFSVIDIESNSLIMDGVLKNK